MNVRAQFGFVGKDLKVVAEERLDTAGGESAAFPQDRFSG
jgi:hypothetical protein